MEVEMSISCSELEDKIRFNHKLEETVKISDCQYDEMADMVIFTIEIDEDESYMVGETLFL